MLKQIDVTFCKTSRILMLCMVSMAPAVFAAGEAMLTVRTDPEGVEVWLNDKYIGDSPIIDKKLTPGRYTLKLVDAVQHSSTTEEIFLQPGETTLVEKSIVGKFGTISVSSEPAGADVYISTRLGKTPLTNNFMNPGKYQLELRHPGKYYVPVAEEVTIPRGKPVTVSKTLERKSPFDTKALLRLGLGAGAVAGYVWAIVAQGNYKENKIMGNADEVDSYAAQRTIGIIIGSVCVVAFEIVAFF